MIHDSAFRRFARRICCLALAAFAACSAGTRAAEAEKNWPAASWNKVSPGQAGMDAADLAKARQYALSGGGSGYVTRGGRLVMSWGDVRRRYDLKSTTKSIGITALALAIKDGKLKLSDLALTRHPSFGTPPQSNAKTGWLERITLRHLATQTAGFEKPGGYGKLLFAPGTRWSYSDGGPNWLAECVTLAYRRDLNDLMFERVFTPLGISSKDLTWRRNAYRAEKIDGIPRREFGSGIHANVDAMARIGLLYLRGGRWGEQQIIPREFVDRVRRPVTSVVGLPEHEPKQHGNASDHYGLLWWNNADGTIRGVPKDAYWSWGLYDSLIVVVPSLDVVVARAGRSWKRRGKHHYDVLAPFLQPIASSVRTKPDGRRRKTTPQRSSAPYPPSRAIARITWAPPESIVRKATGSDNWPITWAGDDLLYTVYGDGWGFVPKTKRKLSLGLATIAGGAKTLRGVNLRSPTAEQVGNGGSGKKASGLLMIDGRLLMLVRNAGNSQLAWSDDGGRTWRWSDWKFSNSFGCPTFLNFGKNYAGARDDYVYIYSQDSDSAYRPVDRMVLARVAKDNILRRDAYEFFVRRDESGTDKSNSAVWTKDVARRGAVFVNPKRCYRSSVSYHATLGRYLWVQVLPGPGSRKPVGLGIFDAPAPWGPWTTAYYAEKWDVDPGESASIPTKWISRDGKTLHLVFSGRDSFSVRRATLVGRGKPRRNE